MNRRLVAIIFLSITIGSIIVWAFSEWLVPILPIQLGNRVILFFVALNAIITLVASGNDIIEFFQKLTQSDLHKTAANLVFVPIDDTSQKTVEQTSNIELEGSGHHSNDFEHRTVYTIKFLLSNSGGNSLALKNIELILIGYRVHKFDPKPISSTIEAGPLRIYQIDAPKLTLNTRKYTLQNELIEIEPNGIVAYSTRFTSHENYTFLVKLVFYWIDAIVGSKHQTESQTIELDFPYAGRGGASYAVGDMRMLQDDSETPIPKSDDEAEAVLMQLGMPAPILSAVINIYRIKRKLGLNEKEALLETLRSIASDHL